MAARPTTPGTYSPRDVPRDDDISPFLTDEFRQIGATLAGLVRIIPQPATAAPKNPVDCMVRMSRSPWRPLVGQTVDTWVYYDAPSATWKALP